jgi:hypothetical protein
VIAGSKDVGLDYVADFISLAHTDRYYNINMQVRITLVSPFSVATSERLKFAPRVHNIRYLV